MTAAEPTVTGDLILRNARIAGAEESAGAARSRRGKTGWPATRRNTRALVLRLARQACSGRRP